MKRAGRANWVIIAGIASIAAIVLAFFLAGKGPNAAANTFMSALGSGDVETLAQVTAIGDDDLAKRRAKWKVTIDRGRHYIFRWKMQDTVMTGEETAAAKVLVIANATLANAFDEVYELPLVKKDDGWKVDAASLNRELYPSLPRPGG